jgi:hypothetical protein
LPSDYEARNTPAFASVASTLKADLKWQKKTLRPLIGYQSHNTPTLTQGDYIKIVDYTGRQLAKGKKGFIRADERRAFDKLGLNPNHWVHRVKVWPRLWRTAASLCGRARRIR